MRAIGTQIKENPYSGANSSYAAWRGNQLVRLPDSTQKPSPLAQKVHQGFRDFVSDTEFSCVGAKAAINGNCYRFGFYPEMGASESTLGLAHDLWNFARERASFQSDYATFVASFGSPFMADEESWEKLLWAQLQKLHELDFPLHAWDAAVSSDSEDANFSFSFAETAFFIVGLHPASSRLARRFAYPTLVFNPHAQFEKLRGQNKFDRMREIIRERELKLQGSLNPNLSNFGEQSEARQYSGRAVEKEWKCPFQALYGKKTAD